MKKALKLLGLALLVALLLAVGSCGSGDGQFPGNTVDCPSGPLAFWDCNMTWDEQRWQ